MCYDQVVYVDLPAARTNSEGMTRMTEFDMLDDMDEVTN